MTIFLCSLAIFLVTGLALACLALCPPTPRRNRAATVYGPAGIVLACTVGILSVLQGPWDGALYATLPWGLPVGTGTIGMDTLSRLFLLPVFGLGAICAISGANTLGHYPEGHNLAAHWFFYTTLLLGLALVMVARDGLLFILAWELMSLSPFFLIDFYDNEPQVRQASWIYLVAAHLGAICLLALFALLWQVAGGTTFTLFGQAAAAGNLAPVASGLFLLALLGFGAKAGLAPLHVWLPEAHPIAPSHISALMSGVMINAGLYGMIRCLSFFGPLHSLPAWWGWTLLVVGLITGLVGICKAAAQSNIKRLLAYSSVENMGIMFMGLGAACIGAQAANPWIATLGLAACLFHMLNHAAYKGLLFLCAGEILHAVNSIRFEHLGGLQKSLPMLGVCFGLGAASIVCLPPFNGFASELVLALGLAGGLKLQALEQQLGLITALVGLALIGGLAAATFAKAYGMAFLGEARTGAARNPLPVSRLALACLLIPAAACVALGLCAPWAFEKCIPAVLQMYQSSASSLPAALDAVVSMGNILSIVTGIGMGGIALTLALSAWRKSRNLTNGLRRAPTWGCGYQAGTPRIQYSAASFSEPTAKLLAAGMGLKTRHSMDKGFFPARASLEVTASDRVMDMVLTPIFEAIARLCDSLKIVQHGRIHLYILYMLVTLILLLVWGLHA